MQLDRNKLELSIARACISTSELIEKSGIGKGTYCNILGRGSARPESIGKIAKALGVDPAEIIKED